MARTDGTDETDETDGFQSLRNAASVAVDHAGLVGRGTHQKGL